MKSTILFQNWAKGINDKDCKDLLLSLPGWLWVTNPGLTSDFGLTVCCTLVMTFDSDVSDEDSGSCPCWADRGNRELLFDLLLSLSGWPRVANPRLTGGFGLALCCRPVMSLDSDVSDKNLGSSPWWAGWRDRVLRFDLPDQKKKASKRTMITVSA